MNEDEEFGLLLAEIPHATSLNLRYSNHQNTSHVHVNGGHCNASIPPQRIHGLCRDDLSCYRNSSSVLPPGGISMHSEGSSSASLSGGLSSSDDGSPSPPEIKPQAHLRDSNYPDGLWSAWKLPGSTAVRNSGGGFIDEVGLTGYLQRMHIECAEKDSSTETFKVETPNRLQFDHHSPRTIHGHFGENGYHDDYRKDFFNQGGLQCSARAGLTSFDNDTRSALFRLQSNGKMGYLSGSNASPGQHEGLFSRPFLGSEPVEYPKQLPRNKTLSNLWLQDHSGFGINCYDRGTQLLDAAPCVTEAFSTDYFLSPQGNGMHSSRDRIMLNSHSPYRLADSKLPFDSEGFKWYDLPMFSETAATLPKGWSTQYHPPVRSSPNIETCSCEESLIIQGKGLNYVINKDTNKSRGHRKVSCDEICMGRPQEKGCDLSSQTHFGGSPAFKCKNGRNSRVCRPLILPPRLNSLMEVQGRIYLMAKDHHGCRFLQKKFDEGTAEDVKMIFNEIIEHVVELMMNPFGNYLMQKLLDVCTEEQRMQIMFMITEEPGQLVKISLNTHGTRAVQKLIETLKMKKQILMVISALEPGFLDLINDLNGNHVIQHCLKHLSNEDNKFIFKAAAKYCVDIATHRHGCCVLQRCIDYSTGEDREKLVLEISANGLLLAQDPFGNYVVQYVLQLKTPTAILYLISQFEGNYVHLSTQKFSSNVVEKCLKYFGEENRSRIVHEFLSHSRFEQLLQDPYANYVIQSALRLTKGPLHASLVEAIRSHADILRTSPYSKRIFSHTLPKK